VGLVGSALEVSSFADELVVEVDGGVSLVGGGDDSDPLLAGLVVPVAPAMTGAADDEWAAEREEAGALADGVAPRVSAVTETPAGPLPASDGDCGGT
jgi:hypothetical protein